MKTIPPRPTSGLWWAAFFIAVIGGSLAYVFSLDKTDPALRSNMSMVLLFTIIAVGVCVICATANWWLRR